MNMEKICMFIYHGIYTIIDQLSIQLNSTKWRMIMIIGVFFPPTTTRNFQGTSKQPRAAEFGV